MACDDSNAKSQGGARASLALGWYEAGLWPARRVSGLGRKPVHCASELGRASRSVSGELEPGSAGASPYRRRRFIGSLALPGSNQIGEGPLPCLSRGDVAQNFIPVE
jgi:hypothetical protein